MDERLEKALEFSNYRATLGVQKKNIRTRMHVLQTVHYNKGSFLADSATIAFANALKQHGKKSAVMIDTKDNPIEISDIDDFIEALIGAYTEATLEYKTQMDKISKARNIKKLMDW